MQLKDAIMLCSGTMIGSSVLVLPLQIINGQHIFSSLLLIVIMALYSIAAAMVSVRVHKNHKAIVENYMKKSMYSLSSKEEYDDEMTLKKDFFDNCSLSLLSKIYIGQIGKSLYQLCTFFLLVSLLSAYINGFSSIMSYLFDCDKKSAVILSGLSLAAASYLGFLVKLNRYLFILKIISFAVIIMIVTLTNTNASNIISYGDFSVGNSIHLLPFLFTAFGFHASIGYFINLQFSSANLLKIFIFSSIITLLIYLIWIIIVINYSDLSCNYYISPETVLGIFKNNIYLSKAMTAFSVFALLTSIIGVSVGFKDFLSPLISNKNFPATIFSFLIPSCIVLYNPQVFIFALSFAGIFLTTIAVLIPGLVLMSQAYFHINEDKSFMLLNILVLLGGTYIIYIDVKLLQAI